MKRFVYFILFSVALLSGGNAEARINLVTLPGRDSVQLTIYNSVDLTVVVEKRVLTFRKGSNRLEFSWANTLIDPTSVEFKALSHADAVEVLDVRFPPRVSNTLEWHIQSEFSGEIEVEIRYFTSGIGWSADYVAEVASREDQMKLSGFVRVGNHSGEDYENAQIRLVLGEIKLVQEIAKLAGVQIQADENRTSKDRFSKLDLKMLLPAVKMELSAKMVSNESLSEYFIYTVEGRDTIPNGWSKRLPALSASGIPLSSLYKFESDHYGDECIRFYQFTNSVASHLGREPLPDGDIQAFRLASNDSLFNFVGHSSTKYIPMNEQVEVAFGNDEEVQVRPKLMQWVKQDLRFDNNGNVAGWTLKQTFQIEMQNSKTIPVTLDIRRSFSGDWTLETTAPYLAVDSNKIKFGRQLTPHSSQTLTYTVITREGTNATR
ncbi:MAG: hypothetical protein JWM04_25 [Verrucomicrobiales bacterium]|nr:hypothetical protein [Verrucomicrobiales bacterium]